MLWLRRHAAWAWPAVLVAGLLGVVAIRIWSGWSEEAMTPMATETEGVIVGESDGLAALARRIRDLQDTSGETRGRLSVLQKDVGARRQHVATLDAMLASDRLTDCPAFLRQQTTVRALQKIIREAADSPRPERGDQSLLSTAAAVARERLRGKLTMLRHQLLEEIADLESQTATLRQRLHLQTTELQRLQRQVRQDLQSRSSFRLPAAHSPTSQTEKTQECS